MSCASLYQEANGSVKEGWRAHLKLGDGVQDEGKDWSSSEETEADPSHFISPVHLRVGLPYPRVWDC